MKILFASGMITFLALLIFCQVFFYVSEIWDTHLFDRGVVLLLT